MARSGWQHDSWRDGSWQGQNMWHVLDGSMTLGGTVLGMTCDERNLGVTRLGTTGAVNAVMSLSVCLLILRPRGDAAS